jgi:hypothetical protein
MTLSEMVTEQFGATSALAAIACMGCASTVSPRTTAARMDHQGTNTFWRIDGPSSKDCWMKLRYVMGEQKASGVMVWSDSDDMQGHHMLVRLQILE